MTKNRCVKCVKLYTSACPHKISDPAIGHCPQYEAALPSPAEPPGSIEAGIARRAAVARTILEPVPDDGAPVPLPASPTEPGALSEERLKQLEDVALSVRPLAAGSIILDLIRDYRRLRGSPGAREGLGPRVMAFAERTFGAVAADPMERATRLAEEALELLQAVGGCRSRAEALVERTYSRPAGSPGKEVGQVALTLIAYCEVAHVDHLAEARREMERIEAIPAEHWRARHAAKAEAGITELPAAREGQGAGTCKTCEGVGLVEKDGPAGVPHTVTCPDCAGAGTKEGG